MKFSTRPELYAFLLALTATLAIAVLVALGRPEPTILDEIALAASVGGAGLAIPGGITSSTTSTSSSSTPVPAARTPESAL